MSRTTQHWIRVLYQQGHVTTEQYQHFAADPQLASRLRQLKIEGGDKMIGPIIDMATRHNKQQLDSLHRQALRAVTDTLDVQASGQVAQGVLRVRRQIFQERLVITRAALLCASTH